MKSNWGITYFKPEKQGVSCTAGIARFSMDTHAEGECGVILYDRKGGQQKFPFNAEGRRGNLYGIEIQGEGIDTCAYNFYKKDETITDPYAREVCGLEKWGSGREKKRRTYGLLTGHDFDWQSDTPPMIPPEESFIYGINVRSFTMHKSSGVKNGGTFEGIAEKIPYLKSLGITAVELMPCYEYDECMTREDTPVNPLYPLLPTGAEENRNTEKVRLNCWGFQKGFYFAPKAAYSAEGSPVYSFKCLVRELHQNGIEVIMHFYFPPEIRQLYMLEVIRYWVAEYHIDGVRISGFHIPVRLLAEDPVLKRTKIRCSFLPAEDLSAIHNPEYKNFFTDNENFKNDLRRFLKGDEGLLNKMLYYQRRNPKEYGVINYAADYDGFSLYDCVSYEKKHNEANGEGNRDGTDLNYTWNCGVEGESRRKGIQSLRLKQIKNALSFVFLSQGIPYIFSGDEFGASRRGNNNCYCQDNETGWIQWKDNHFSREILSCTRFLSRLRRSHPILHMRNEFRVMDSIGCGYPDVSYHGIEAWRPDFGYVSRIVGILLYGRYAERTAGKDGAACATDDSFYIACNMHWEDHDLALPILSKSRHWIKISDTALPAETICHRDAFGAEEQNSGSDTVTISSRSISVFKAEAVY